MIGLDSNILIRFLARDDSVQSRRAVELIEQQLSEQNPGFVSLVTIVETAWVLERSYRLSDAIVAAAIERTLQIDSLVIEHEGEVSAAMETLKAGLGSFADALIGELGARAGCAKTMTFDRQAAALPNFQLL